MKVNLMLDIETLGTRSNSIIFAIGACKFGKSKILETFYRRITIDSCKAVGLKADKDTVKWWCEQSKEAQKELITDKDRVSIQTALYDFNEWINTPQNNVIPWGNGAIFDIGLMENAYDACQIEKPWIYQNIRCYRTVKNLLESWIQDHHKCGEHHNAIDDACTQANHLMEMLKS